MAHDEFWNLHPTTKSINSSKGNNLPDWGNYFPIFAELEYLSYSMMWKYDTLKKEFDKCAKLELRKGSNFSLRKKKKGLSQMEEESILAGIPE